MTGGQVNAKEREEEEFKKAGAKRDTF